MSQHFKRLICWYDHNSDEAFVGSQIIIDVSHQELVSIFGTQNNDPDFLNCYLINKHIFTLLSSYFLGEPNFESYQYFLETQAANIY
jgi:hypothetical protein